MNSTIEIIRLPDYFVSIGVRFRGEKPEEVKPYFRLCSCAWLSVKCHLIFQKNLTQKQLKLSYKFHQSYAKVWDEVNEWLTDWTVSSLSLNNISS